MSVHPSENFSLQLTGNLDGYKFEGVFKKTRLNCQNVNDPYLQAALILHNPQDVNEVFLLSLRDCILTLSEDHFLKRWYIESAAKKTKREAKDSLQIMIEESSSILLKDSISKKERGQISQLLSLLDKQPPYLDYILLRILSYAKIGNWSRSEKIIIDFIEMDPIERIRQTPWRGDNSLLSMKTISYKVMEEISKVIEQKILLDSFFQVIKDFYSDSQLIKEADSLQELSLNNLVEKLQLRYNFLQTPAFASWMSSQYLSNEKRDLFLSNYLDRDLKYSWILLGNLPDSSSVREKLAKKMSFLKNEHTHVFYHLASREDMLGVIARVDSGLLKNIKNTKRQYYSTLWQVHPQDYWAIANLISMGKIDDAFLIDLTQL